MSFHHRLPALITAFISSMAVMLAAFSGASCDFLSINARPNSLLVSADGEDLSGTEASIGILCERGFYDREGDDMWELSRIFLIVSLALGSLTAALAWAVSSYLPPTETNWKGLSVLAAITAVLQVPIFCLYMAEPCADFQSRQTCALGPGSYLLMASDVLFVAVTLCTQYMDPPKWALELAIWRAPKHGESRRPVPRGGDNYDDDDDEEDDDTDAAYDARFARESNEEEEEEQDDEAAYRITRIMPASLSFHQQKEQEAQKWNKFLFFFNWFRRPPRDVDVKVAATESINDDDDYNYEQTLDDSRLILRVLPDGNLPKDDGRRSISSYDGIDSMLKRAEEGKLNSLSLDDDGQNHPSADDDDDDKDSMNLVMPSNLQQFRGKRVYAEDVERHHVLDSPQRSVPQENPLTGDDILADLQVPPLPLKPPSEYRSKPRSESQSSSGDDDRAVLLNAHPETSSSSTNKLMAGVRNLTRTLKRERQQTRRKIRRGYSEMMDDFQSDDGDGKRETPPFEVEFPSSQEQNATMADQFLHDVSDDDDDLLDLEDWKALRGEGSGGTPFPDVFSNDQEPFDYNEADPYHSDPEREIRNGDILRVQDLNGDESIHSDDRSSEYSESHESSDSKSRGRSKRKEGKRRRRPVSPVESIKSNCSLLHTTINEETEEDIVKELGVPYSIARTLSAPIPGASLGGKMAAHPLKRMESFNANPNPGKMAAHPLKRMESFNANPNPGKMADHPLKRMESFDLVQTLKSKGNATDAAEPMRLPEEESKLEPRAAVGGGKTTDVFPSDEIGFGRNSNSNGPLSDELKSDTNVLDEENRNNRRSVVGESVIDASTTAGHSHSAETETYSDTATEGLSTKSIDLTSNNCTSHAREVAPMDELSHESKEIDESPEHVGSGKTTINSWKEPMIPARKIWKNLDHTKVDSSSFSNHSWKEPSTKDERQDPAAINTTGETSDTDDTGCLSRTSESDSEDSIGGFSDSGPRRVIGRSRSSVGTKNRIGKIKYSKSLSPKRSRKIYPLLWKGSPVVPDDSNVTEDIPSMDSLPLNSSSRAREIRIRRLQRGKGYVPLEGKPKRAHSLSYDSPNSPRTSNHDSNPMSEESTPRRKTLGLSDEKKEDDASYCVASDDVALESLYQPSLSPSDGAISLTRLEKLEAEIDAALEVQSTLIGSSPEYDAVLDDLDLQLIDLRRPIGAEYGDDESSL